MVGGSHLASVVSGFQPRGMTALEDVIMHLLRGPASAGIIGLGLILILLQPNISAQEQLTAQAAPQPSASPTATPVPYLTGDWGGARSRLAQEGIVFRGSIFSEFAGNPVGGLQQGTALASQLELGTDINFGKLDNSGAGTVHFTFTAREGSSLSANAIGNIMAVQEIFGDGLTPRLTELSYE
jgi:porin